MGPVRTHHTELMSDFPIKLIAGHSAHPFTVIWPQLQLALSLTTSSTFFMNIIHEISSFFLVLGSCQGIFSHHCLEVQRLLVGELGCSNQVLMLKVLGNDHVKSKITHCTCTIPYSAQ